MKHRQTSW